MRVSLRTLRILSRDKKVLGPLVTDGALLMLAKLAGLTTSDASDESSEPDSDFYDNVIASLVEAKVLRGRTDEDEGDVEADDQRAECFDEDAKSDISTADSGDLDSIGCSGSHRTSIDEMHRGSMHHKVLERGRRDRRESKMEGEEEEEEGGSSGDEAQRKEALKVLSNVVYNSTWAQERFSGLRWASSRDADINMHTQHFKTLMNPAVGCGTSISGSQ